MGMIIRKGQTISKFKIVDILPEGSGGMATVVKALCLDNSHHVALKISRSSNFDSFSKNALISEVEILRKLNHPGIVKIFPIPSESGKIVFMERATEISGGPWFFSMEYLEGGSLGDLLKRTKNLTEEESLAIVFRIVRTLDYIHSQGYAHNDIKLNNILFRNILAENSLFDPVLIDFGISRKKERIQQDAGSLQYMAPEQLEEIRNERPPELPIDGGKVDTYAIGVLLYRMLVSRLPLTGFSDAGITTAIKSKIPIEPDQINPKISKYTNDLIMSCLAKKPEARPSNAQMLGYLKRFVDCPFISNGNKKFLSRFNN